MRPVPRKAAALGCPPALRDRPLEPICGSLVAARPTSHPRALNRSRSRFSGTRRSSLPPGSLSFLPSSLHFQNWQPAYKEAIPLSRFRGLGPLAVASSSPVAGRVVLLGDALLYLDSVTGEGISLSFAQAELLARYLPYHLETGQISQESLQSLAKVLTQSTSAYLKMTRLALSLTRHPWLRTLSLRALSRSPRFFQHCLEATMDRKEFRQLPLATLPQLARGMLHPRRQPFS